MGKRFDYFKRLMEQNVPLSVVRQPSDVGAIVEKESGSVVAKCRGKTDYILPHVGHELFYDIYGGGVISALIAIRCRTCAGEILADADESE